MAAARAPRTARVGRSGRGARSVVPKGVPHAVAVALLGVLPLDLLLLLVPAAAWEAEACVHSRGRGRRAARHREQNGEGALAPACACTRSCVRKRESLTPHLAILLRRQDDTLRVSDPLRIGFTFCFYHVLWKEPVPPGLYVLVMVAEDEVGSLTQQVDLLQEEVQSGRKDVRGSERKLAMALQAKDAELARLTRRNEVLGEAVTRLTNSSQSDEASANAAVARADLH